MKRYWLSVVKGVRVGKRALDSIEAIESYGFTVEDIRYDGDHSTEYEVTVKDEAAWRRIGDRAALRQIMYGPLNKQGEKV